MNRVTLMGIDGSGKTTLMRAVQAAAANRASFCFSPDFHDISGFPGAAESRALTEFSRLADSHADPCLKLASLYLRMCAFGEAEAFLLATERRPTLCIERHPLLDSLTYLPVYIAAVKRSGARPETSDATLARIAQDHPEVAGHVAAAIARRNGRLGITDASASGIANYCMAFGGYAPADFVRALSRDYQTGLPNVLLYLDVPPSLAFARIGARGKPLEAHESLENLIRLDHLARSKFSSFEALGVSCHTLVVSGLPEADVVRGVTRHFDAAGP